MTPDETYNAAIGPCREDYQDAKLAEEAERKRPGKREENEAYLEAQRNVTGPEADFKVIRDAAFADYFAVLATLELHYHPPGLRAYLRYDKIVTAAWKDCQLALAAQA